jgi:ankyrin repeat protein
VVLRNAARYGNTKAIEHLLNNDADVNLAEDGKTALLEATLHGRVEAVKYLLGRGAAPTVGNDPLMAATGPYGHPDIVLQLLQAKADPNSPGVLRNAARYGNNKAVEHLLDAGAHVNLEEDRKTALLEATLHGRVETVKYLLGRGAAPTVGNDPLIAATGPYGHPDIVLQLLQAKADPNSPGVLRNAARYGNNKAIKHLLDAGAHVNLEEDGKTALLEATLHGRVETVKYLQRRGANPDRK